MTKKIKKKNIQNSLFFNQSGNLFGNNSIYENNKKEEKDSLNININKKPNIPSIFNDLINFNNKNRKPAGSLIGLNNPFLSTKLRNNKIDSNQERIECNHENNYVCYCLEKKEDKGGLLCFECLYNYNKDLSKCIPIKTKSFEKYKEYYRQYIKKYKNNLKNKFDEIISILEEYENEEIENISTLFEEKVNLNFELPIEIPFIERFEIAINKKILSLLNKELFDKAFNQKIINSLKFIQK